MSKPRYALLSVSDKTHLIEFATQLKKLGFELLSTGGTYQHLSAAGFTVSSVSSLTEFPEILGGRVKTLHPKVHAGILHRGEVDAEVLATHDLPTIDVVVVNLYPFQQTIENEACTLSDAIEQIDIGGPCLLRAAAKNHQRVWVVCQPSDYGQVADELAAVTADSTSFRQQLALRAFAHTAKYDACIADYLCEKITEKTPHLPETFALQAKKADLELRYGENPHQSAAVYHWGAQHAGVLNAKQHQGKPLSYNNLLDADAAYRIIQQQTKPFCAIIKHTNPCGGACADDILNAYQKAYQCDPISAFGGIIAINRPLNETLAQTILEQQFVEVIIAPGFTQQALTILKQKPNLRALEVSTSTIQEPQLTLRTIQGALLVQTQDSLSKDNLNCVTSRQPSAQEASDLWFAWDICRHVTSNAIVYAKDHQTLGIGAGQMSRIFSAEIGLMKAQQASLSVQGAVMASDAFFPFPDSVENAAAHGITAIIQPGGGMRDQEVIECANQYDIAMIFTGERHFRH